MLPLMKNGLLLFARQRTTNIREHMLQFSDILPAQKIEPILHRAMPEILDFEDPIHTTILSVVPRFSEPQKNRFPFCQSEIFTQS